jgi:hypothetical protein
MLHSSIERKSLINQFASAILKCLLYKDFDKIDILIEDQTPRDMKTFYNRWGNDILYYCLNVWREPYALEYISTRIPRETFLSLLMAKDYGKLNNFFGVYCNDEWSGACTEELREQRNEKIKLLLSLNDPDLTENINRNLTKLEIMRGLEKNVIPSEEIRNLFKPRQSTLGK